MGTTHLDLVRANFGRRSDIQGELRQIDEAATTDKRARTETEETKVSELRSELKDIDARIVEHLEIETRSQQISDSLGAMLGAISDHERGHVIDTRSIGQRMAESAEVGAWMGAGGYGTSPRVEVRDDEFRAVTDLTAAGAQVQATRLSRIGRSFLDRRVFLSDLLPHISIEGAASAEVVTDTSPLIDSADKAAAVADGGSKPQAGITLTPTTEKIAIIAAHANLTRRTARVAKTVAGYYDGRLAYSVKRNADKQVVGGDGTGNNLLGLLNRSGLISYAPGAAEARYKSIRHAIRLMEDAEAVPEIIVLNPADAELFDLSNDTSNGLHAVANVADGGARTAWGLEQVRSTAIAAGTALLIDPMAVAVLDADVLRGYMTDSHSSNFTSNLLTLLREMELGLALFDPNGVSKITFNGAV